MALQFQRVIVAGASGSLGSKILQHLLEESRITKITILSRSASKATFPSSPILNIIKLDNPDEADLVSAFKDHDIFISAANDAKLDALYLSAAIKAGVQRFMPSEYTLDLAHPRAREMGDHTFYSSKVDVIEQLNRAAEKGDIEYTTIVPAGFLDWGLAVGFLGFNIPGRKATLYDQGIHKVTGVTLDFLARSVVAVLKMPRESTRNKRIRVAEVRFTGRELLDALEDAVGEKFEVTLKTTASLVEASKEGVKEGDMAKAAGIILALYYDGSGAGDLSDGLEWNSSGEFKLSRKSLKDVVHEVVDGSGR